MGFLSQPSHGYFWDERTGVVTGVQVIGREIWDRNAPLVSCSDSEGMEPDPQLVEQIIYVMSENSQGDSCMSCCLKWVDGVLYYLYCGEWTPVPGNGPNVATVGIEDGFDDGNTSTGEPPEYSACGKAGLLADLLFTVANSMWSRIDNFDVWNHVKEVQSDAWGYDLVDKWILAGIGQMLAMELGEIEPFEILEYTPTSLFSSGQKEAMRIMLSSLVTGADASGIKQELYEQFRTRWSERFLPDVNLYTMWYDVISAVPYGVAQEVSALGSTLGDDYSCEPSPAAPDPTYFWSQLYDWVLDVDWVNDDVSAWTLSSNNGTTAQTSEGLTVIDDTVGGESSQAQLLGTVTGGSIKAVHQEWILAGNGDDGNLGIQMTPYTNMQAVETYIVNGNTARTVVNVNHTIVAALNVAAEGSYDEGFTPAFHVIKRTVWAGTGTPPVAGL